MKITKKLKMKYSDLNENGAITIVAFGDSVTQGAIDEKYDYENVYHNVLRKKLNELNPEVPVNVINSGVSGNAASYAFIRTERDVIRYQPDLCIVDFGLNDVNYDIKHYHDHMRIIFEKLKNAGIETIFMTPNMLPTRIDENLSEKNLERAPNYVKRQNDGTFDKYVYGAVEIAKELGVIVCDCYSEWKKLYANGEDITSYLTTLVHPNAELHKLFANMLYDIILKDYNKE
jgi:lysophospholipase L1-like esterase